MGTDSAKAEGLRPGDVLGPYTLIDRIGAGGMGEVFRAHDGRLNRAVAVKVLPADFASDPDRLSRFDQEAKTLAALNHPNLMMVFDSGTHKGAPFLVSELLEGKTLREELRGGALPIRRALEYGLQIASGLAAAHAQGFVHRDIKPENLFITNQGRVKILDFGLAKFWQGVKEPKRTPKSGVHKVLPVDPDAKTVLEDRTEAGVVMGTPAYMSPEQVTGEDADSRSDIFSLGAVLYEMFTGQRAFRRGTSSQTMSAVLREEPEDPAQYNINLPEGLDRVVRRCLEKRPEQRFQSASDLAFALESLAAGAGIRRRQEPAGRIQKWIIPFVVSLAALAVIRMAILPARVVHPEYEQITFQRGTVMNARFAPDGKTVVYGARWNMNPLHVFVSQPGNPEARRLEPPKTDVLSVSKAGELAILLDRKASSWFFGRGTLAQMAMNGNGAPKLMTTNVQEADWYPDGKRLAVVRWDGNARCLLEENNASSSQRATLADTRGLFGHPRVSPNGEWVAFASHPVATDSQGSVCIANHDEVRTLTPVYDHLEGLAWNPKGTEIWFTAYNAGESQTLRAVDLKGRERLILNAPVNMTLHDISPAGELLMTRLFELQEIVAAQPPGDYERNVTTMGRSLLRDVSADGSKFVLIFFGESTGANFSTYLSHADGTPSVLLGPGYGHALSPDGRWVFASRYDPSELVLLPTGPEDVRKMAITNLMFIERDSLGSEKSRSISNLDVTAASWLPDNRRLVLSGREGTNGVQYFLLDTESNELTEVTRSSQGVKPPTYFGVPLSPDGKFVVGGVGTERRIYPLNGGASWKLPGIEDCKISGWSSDSNFLYVHVQTDQATSSTVQIKRYDLAKKELEPESAKVIHPADLSGSLGSPAVAITSDGKGYVYFNWRVLTDLFIVRGLMSDK